MKFTKSYFFTLIFVLFTVLSLTSCGSKSSMSSVFPNIKSDDIPDILEKSVGNLGDTYFTSFDATEDNDYQSYLKATFENTTEADYQELMEHYQSTSTGTHGDDILLYDWGWLEIIPDGDSITIEAYIL